MHVTINKVIIKIHPVSGFKTFIFFRNGKEVTMHDIIDPLDHDLFDDKCTFAVLDLLESAFNEGIEYARNNRL